MNWCVESKDNKRSLAESCNLPIFSSGRLDMIFWMSVNKHRLSWLLAARRMLALYSELLGKSNQISRYWRTSSKCQRSLNSPLKLHVPTTKVLESEFIWNRIVSPRHSATDMKLKCYIYIWLYVCGSDPLHRWSIIGRLTRERNNVGGEEIKDKW